jgi:hypothetical protein
MTNTTNPAIETISIRESAPMDAGADRRIRVHQSATGDHAYTWLYWRDEDGILQGKYIRLTADELDRLADQIATVRSAIRDFTNPATRIVAGRSSRLNRG